MSIQSAKIIGENISTEVYRRQEYPVGHSQHVMSRGSLMEFSECPHRWLNGVENGDTIATEWGSLMDCLVLQPHRFDQEFAVAPTTYKTTGMKCPSCNSITDSKSCRQCKCDRVQVEEEKPWSWKSETCQEWARANNGKTIVDAETWKNAQAAFKSLECSFELWSMLQQAKRQIMAMAVWKDRATGLEIPLKVLIDFNPQTKPFEKSLGDLKTGRSANPRRHARETHDRWYDAQAALYIDVYRAATNEDKLDFVHVLQENTAPYEVTGYVLSEEFINAGRAKYESALRLYAQCLKTGFWPGYETDLLLPNGYILKPEPWMIQSAGERIFNMPSERQEEPDREPSEVMP